MMPQAYADDEKISIRCHRCFLSFRRIHFFAAVSFSLRFRQRFRHFLRHYFFAFLLRCFAI